MSVILKGAPVVAAMNEANAARCAALREKGVVPTLAVVRVGAREDDLSYEKGVMARCAKVGVEVKQFLLPADAAQEELLGVIACINADPSIHGCLLFRPLPRQFDDRTVRAALAPEKDIDGITDGSLAGVFTNTALGYPPCTAQACLEILKFYGIPLSGRRAVVVGRSLVVGKPAAMMLDRENATVTLCNSRTRDLPEVCREADIVVVAMGKAGAVARGAGGRGRGHSCQRGRKALRRRPLWRSRAAGGGHHPRPRRRGYCDHLRAGEPCGGGGRKDRITSLLGKKQRGPSAKDDPLCFCFIVLSARRSALPKRHTCRPHRLRPCRCPPDRAAPPAHSGG